MMRQGEAFVGIDTAKERNAVAVAEGDRNGEVRYLGEFDNTPDAVAKLVRRLAERYGVVHYCYEAGRRDTGCIGRSERSGRTAVSSRPR